MEVICHMSHDSTSQGSSMTSEIKIVYMWQSKPMINAQHAHMSWTRQ